MVKNLRRKLGEWIVIRLPFLGLTLSIFFVSYFPAISRYSVNTLFNTQKRGYFDFLFANLQLRNNTDFYHAKGEDNLGISLFGIIIFICYASRIVSEALLVFYRERAKQSFKKLTSERFGIEEDTAGMESFSERIVADSVSFFSCFCELFIDLWAVIRINRTRGIKNPILLKTLLCTIVIVSGITVVKSTSGDEEISKENQKLLPIIAKFQRKLVFSEVSTIFTALYFVFFPKNEEVINAVLLGFNVSSVLGKLRRFTQVAPRVISIHKIWRETRKMYMDKLPYTWLT